MAAHHGAEHLSGQIQRGLFNGALNQAGALHQIGEFLQQLIGKIRSCIAAAGACGDGVSNQLAALLAVHHHTGLRQRVGVGRRRWNRDLGCHQAVATTDTASLHRRITTLQAELHHLLIEQRHEPTDRP